jgi:hypothetical protein
VARGPEQTPGCSEARTFRFSGVLKLWRRSAAHRHLFHPPGVKLMTGCFLLHRPMARRPALTGRSAARGISTGVTFRGTPGRAVEGGQPVRVGFRFRAVRLGFRRSQAAHRPLSPKQMITKMATAVNPQTGLQEIFAPKNRDIPDPGRQIPLAPNPFGIKSLWRQRIVTSRISGVKVLWRARRDPPGLGRSECYNRS